MRSASAALRASSAGWRSGLTTSRIASTPTCAPGKVVRQRSETSNMADPLLSRRRVAERAEHDPAMRRALASRFGHERRRVVPERQAVGGYPAGRVHVEHVAEVPLLAIDEPLMCHA